MSQVADCFLCGAAGDLGGGGVAGSGMLRDGVERWRPAVVSADVDDPGSRHHGIGILCAVVAVGLPHNEQLPQMGRS